MTTDPLPSPAPGARRPHSIAVILPGIESVAESSEAARLSLLQFHETPQELGVFDTEPDWTDGRYRLYIAHSEADCIRYGQGKRYEFCISRRHDNYYHDYRAKYQSRYYFVYDRACTPYEHPHVTVVAVRPDGSAEFTFANNFDDHRTSRFNNCLDAFLATKPGLEQARALFVGQQPDAAAVAAVAAARAAEGPAGLPFAQLRPDEQLQYVQLGRTLTDVAYAQAPPALRDVYIARAHLLSDAQAACSTERQRWRAAQLYGRYNQVDRQRPAPWLSQYPTVPPALGPWPNWPPSAAYVAGWFGSTLPPTPLLESPGPAPEDEILTGPGGALSRHRLHQVVSNRPVRLFPVHELAVGDTEPENQDTLADLTADAVVIMRLNGGYQVLTGGTRVQRAQRSGELEVLVRLATRADLAYARADSSQTLLDYALACQAHNLADYATLLLGAANVPLPARLLAAG